MGMYSGYSTGGYGGYGNPSPSPGSSPNPSPGSSPSPNPSPNPNPNPNPNSNPNPNPNLNPNPQAIVFQRLLDSIQGLGVPLVRVRVRVAKPYPSLTPTRTPEPEPEPEPGVPLGGCERIQGNPTSLSNSNPNPNLNPNPDPGPKPDSNPNPNLTRYATPLRVRRPPAQLPDRRAVRRALSVRVRVAVAGCVDTHAPGSPYYTNRPSSALRGLEWALLGPVTHDAPYLGVCGIRLPYLTGGRPSLSRCSWPWHF